MHYCLLQLYISKICMVYRLLQYFLLLKFHKVLRNELSPPSATCPAQITPTLAYLHNVYNNFSSFKVYSTYRVFLLVDQSITLSSNCLPTFRTIRSIFWVHALHINPFKSQQSHALFLSHIQLFYDMRGPFCIYVHISFFFGLFGYFASFFFWLFLVACLIFLSLSISTVAHLFDMYFVFPTCHGLCLPNKRGEKSRRGREIAAAGLTVYFPFNSRVFFRFFFVGSNQYCCQKTTRAERGRRAYRTEILSLLP